ncbi:MAG: hypothetical protein LLG44_08585 [Chloroflexi bacterium]|nr:hypothetical protein [Chloroflexota bacterium]
MEPPAKQVGHSALTSKGALSGLFILVFIVLTISVLWQNMHPVYAGDADSGIASHTPSNPVYLPEVIRMPTPTAFPPTGASYSAIPVEYYQPPERDDDQHADLNLYMRGYELTNAPLNLVDISGSTDIDAPNLSALFNPRRLPNFTAAYKVYDWNWDQGARGALLSQWPVTLIWMEAALGEVIYLPYRSPYVYGWYNAMVLYATNDQITISYTPKGSVSEGYTVHIVNIWVDPALIALYQACNSNGRHELPGLSNWQPIGRAKAGGIGVAIRDNGTFMDPRSRKDWWTGW